MPNKKRPAIFFDRDGTLMPDVPYCNDPGLVHVFASVPAMLDRVREAGFLRILITNQSGIGRGLISLDQYEAVQAELIRQIGPGRLDATYFCPELPTSDSPRRKPAPGMIFEADAQFGIDLAGSWFIGDRPSDAQCGHNAGTKSILVRTGKKWNEAGVSPDHITETVFDAVDLILGTLEA